MKKYLITLAMVLALGLNADAAAQKHRHTPRTETIRTQSKPFLTQQPLPTPPS